jgi:hypothetical protein
MPTLQHFDYNGTDVQFYDWAEELHSVKCKAKDLHIVEPEALNLPAIKAEIAEDINSS